jgi:predicted transposase/invertase (TIGR01784 family)
MSDPIIMKSFLNAILDGDENTITRVKFENVEKTASQKDKRGVTFDLLCITNKGASILIEMQNSCQKFFKTRANFYVYKLMDSKIKRGFSWRKMKKDIPKIIGIFILGKNMSDIDKAVTRTAECDLDTGKIFWDRHRKYFVSLPQFSLDANNMTKRDIWFDFFKNLGRMENIDQSVYERADEGLLRLIEKAKIGALSEKEHRIYEASLKELEDEVDMEEEGYERGLEEGRKEGLEEGEKIGVEKGRKNNSIQIAKEMKKEGMNPSLIAKLTKLSLDEIETL